MLDTIPSPVSGVTSTEAVALIQLQRHESFAEIPFLSRAFRALATAEASVLFVSQTSIGQTLSLAVAASGLENARWQLGDEFAKEIEAGVISISLTSADYTVVSVTGEKMRHRPGTAGRVFQTLGMNGVNIVAIAQDSSERDISFVIKLVDKGKALQALQEAFAITPRKQIHLFLCGVGQVGAKLIEQLANHEKQLLAHNLEIRLSGICNSKGMFLSSSGIPLRSWKEISNENKVSGHAADFVESMKKLNLPNAIFIDCTATDEVPQLYRSILEASISVVTPNKRANSGSLQQYQELRDAARRSNVKFFYETNVGAGLPIIGTLNDLLVSGDEIIRIEAVLSGTLSFIFNSFRPGVAFSDVVREAKAKGYTEPDPRDDLSGKDFARKLLILAREMGIPMREEDVEVESLVPPDCAAVSGVEAFFTKLKDHDAGYSKLSADAESRGCAIRYIGFVEKGRAKVALQLVDREHPFYALSGSDNIISFTTQRYLDRPLVVKGPGAGVDVTAAGVLADIVRVASYLQ